MESQKYQDNKCDEGRGRAAKVNDVAGTHLHAVALALCVCVCARARVSVFVCVCVCVYACMQACMLEYNILCRVF